MKLQKPERVEEAEVSDNIQRGAYCLNNSTYAYTPSKFDLHKGRHDLPPGVKNVEFFGSFDFNESKLEKMGLDGDNLAFMKDALTWMNPGILNIVHENGVLAPLLTPDQLRIITRSAVLEKLTSMNVTLFSNKFKAVGVAGVLGNLEGKNTLYDGLVDIALEKGGISENIQVLTDEEIEGELPLAAGLQLAHYPVAAQNHNRNNLRGLIGSIEGENISPEMIHSIVIRTGAKKPYGLVVVMDGEQICNGPLTIPDHTLEHPREFAEYSTPKSASGSHRGFGVGTSFEELGVKLHLHTTAGHLQNFSGKMWFILSPGESETTYTYK